MTAATVQDRPKGVVAPAQARTKFRMERYLPPPALAAFLDHVWIVEWDLEGQPPFVQRTLPYPCVHLVFHSRVRSGVWGVPGGAFDYALKGAGMMAAAAALLAPQLPAPDPQAGRVGAILRTIESTPGLTRVEQLAESCGMGVRSLQQLFSDYVGVSPKWAIRRFRLHEAADRLANGADEDLAALAQSLGYFDQAHFTSDFRKLVGQTPAHYRKSQRPN